MFYINYHNTRNPTQIFTIEKSQAFNPTLSFNTDHIEAVPPKQPENHLFKTALEEFIKAIQKFASIVHTVGQCIKNKITLQKNNSQLFNLALSFYTLIPSFSIKQRLKTNKDYGCESHSALLDKALTYFQKAKIQAKIQDPLSFYFPNQCQSEKAIIDEMLDNHQGFCIGEYHAHLAPKDFLMQNMAYLKSKGVKVLFIEYFLSEYQKELDDFFSSSSFTPPKSLTNFFEKITDHYGYEISMRVQLIIRLAREQGIRVVGIDHIHANQTNNYSHRALTMNYYAYKLIKNEIPKLNGEKYVVFMGGAHLGRSYQDIPGVADLLATPRIFVSDETKFLSLKPTIIIKDVKNYLARFGQKEMNLNADALIIRRNK